MLANHLRVSDVIEHGIFTKEPDGGVVAVFDSTYAFVVLKANHGVVKKVKSGPFYPNKKTP